MPREPSAQQRIRLVIRIYWWIGVVGLWGGVPGLIIIWAIAAFNAPPAVESLIGLLILCGHLSVFASSLYVAKRLANRPKGIYRFARLVGIVLATLWFPWLTIPGAICVWNLGRHFAAYAATDGEKNTNRAEATPLSPPG